MNKEEAPWIRVADKLPPKGVVVDTKIDRDGKITNHQELKVGGEASSLWFVPDGTMYVYYVPTHWRY